ncbi:MAG: protein kinase domain-containing protein [Myxococcota bacterium]
MSESRAPATRSCPECRELSPIEALFCCHCGFALASRVETMEVETRAAFEPQPVPSQRGARPANSTFPLHDRATELPHFADPLIGRTIAERYRILEQIGRGGMGVVYRVEHARIGKLMALKLLTGELTRDGVQVARFKREALMASRLSHPNTVQVFDFGTADGLVYLAMEYLRGEDLGRIIRREGALPVERAARLVVQIASSLAEAHEKGIIHRDLKPENILIVRGHSGEEVVKVLDFGLAKLRESSELSDVTSRGAIVGTPYYMSPEQIRGEGAEPSSDVYSLGALMYICLTGEPVFDANTPLGVFTKHLLEQPVPPHLRKPERNIPESVSRLVLSTLEKDPHRRPPSVTALQEGLVRCLQNDSGVERLLLSGEVKKLTDEDAAAATRAEVERYEQKLRRRNRLAQGALIFAGLALLTAGGVALKRFLTPPAFQGREIEPNDAASQANPVPFAASVTGQLGRRIDRERSDRDFYRISVPRETPLVRLATSSLPNIASCTWLYPAGSESPFGRYCTGAPGKDLVIEQLALPPGEYLVAVMQDRDVYTRSGAPPVHENVSDEYRLQLTTQKLDTNREVEPNDTPRNPNQLAPGYELTGKLAFMRDADVICSTGAGAIRFSVEETDAQPRPRESLLQVKALSGPDQDVPVRIHRVLQNVPRSPRDAQSPWRSAKIEGAGSPACIELTLVPNPWGPSPPPDVPPASETEYVVRVESL